MTDYTYRIRSQWAESARLRIAVVALALTAVAAPVHAQDSDIQLNDTLFNNDQNDAGTSTSGSPTRPSTPIPRLPTITEPQPESRIAPPSRSPSLFRGPVGASDGLFSGPVDPDTQDTPSLGGTADGEGARIGLPRQTGEIQPGQRDDRRVTPTGRVVRPGEPGFDTARSVTDDASQTATPAPLFQSLTLDTDIDPDLRDTFDDDLLIRDSFPAGDPATGPTVGASQLLQNRGTVALPGNTSFTAPRRQDFPSIDNDRPYDPLGLRAGSFIFLPTVTATTVVTDNVLNDSGPTEADIGLELRPTLRIQSDWNRHSLSLDTNGTFVFYNEFDSENTQDIAVVAQGRLDITGRTNIELDAGYQLATEQRGSANSTSGALTQPDVETIQAGIALNHRFNRLVTRTRLGYTKEINGDAELVDGTVDLGSDEDFTRFDIASRLTYEFSPSFAAFVDASYEHQNFEIGADADGILRDADGYELRLGAIAEIGPAIRGELSVGYATQISDDSSLSDVEGFVLDADILWRPNALTSLNLTAQTDLSSSTLAGSLGSIAYQTALNVRHEFRRYAIGTLGFGWAYEDFEGSSVTENEFTFQIGGEYLFTRNLAALASYQYTDFNTSVANSDFEVNEFRIGVQLRR